jgi:hypothetical protein
MDRKLTPNFVDPYEKYTNVELEEEKPSATVVQKDDTVIITIINTFLENGDEIKLFFRADDISKNDAEVKVKLSGSSPFEVVLSTKSLSDLGLKNGIIYAVNYTNGKSVFGTTTFDKGLEFRHKEDKGGCNAVYMSLALFALIPLLSRRRGK